MPITYLEPLAAGNAMRVYMDPPPRAVMWRVLRRTADVFTGADDVGAVVVADDCTDNVVLDLKALVNGTRYFYRLYAWDGAVWTASESVSGQPGASYRGDTIDPLAILAERLRAGLAVEIERGALMPQSDDLPVYTAPYVLSDQITFPCVTLHMDSEAPAERGIGDDANGSTYGLDGWEDFQGWVARVQINIAAVSRTSDERHALRRALVRILQANLVILEVAGLDCIEWTFADSEELTDKAAPLFLTGGTLACMCHSFVATAVPTITDTTANAVDPWSNQ